MARQPHCAKPRRLSRATEPDVVVIQDFVRVLEYLCKATYVFHVDGSPQEAETWVLERTHTT